jgi:hypothetical protein
MTEIRFTDVHPAYSSATYYHVVNEDVILWQNLLQGTRVRRAAGICSAGEIAFFSLLQSARTELTLVDHSYTSLAVAMIKYMLLSELGFEETWNLLKSEEALNFAFRERVEQLPTPELQTSALKISQRIGTYMARSWARVPQHTLRNTPGRLDRINFIHGDLADLEETGPYGLLYVSNANQHYGRLGALSLRDLGKLVRPGGYMAVAEDRYSSCAPGTWKKVNEVQGRAVPEDANLIAGWKYSLYEIGQSA